MRVAQKRLWLIHLGERTADGRWRQCCFKNNSVQQMTYPQSFAQQAVQSENENAVQARNAHVLWGGPQSCSRHLPCCSSMWIHLLCSC